MSSESLQHGLIWVDRAGVITGINSQALSILGLPQQEVRGRRLTEIFPETRLAEVFTTGQPLVGTTYQGLNHTFRVNYFPLPEENKAGALIVLEQGGPPSSECSELFSLQNLIELYEALLAELPLCLVVVDKQGKIVFLNRYYRSLLGLEEKPLAGLPVLEVIPFTRLPEVIVSGCPYLNPELEFGGQKLLLAEIPLKKNSGQILGGSWQGYLRTSPGRRKH